MSGALPVQTDTPPLEEKMDKSLQKENKKLRGEIKQMEMKIKTMQVELNKSYQMKDKLEALCRELQKQNKFIKAESSAKIQEANIRGKELAAEVQNNMGFMKSINENLAAISSESLTVKKENEELAKKIAILKGHYEEREQILQSALKETHESLQKSKLELGETKLKNAEEKEKLFSEMQKLADALLQSREQIKDAKETELTLQKMIHSYEEKFNGLQKALKDTNGSYEDFKSEMNKVSGRTKDLEKETVKWQQRWEDSNAALRRMAQNYQKVQEELLKSQDSLEKMKSLCRTLHSDNRNLLTELRGHKGQSESEMAPLSDAVAETLASITNNSDAKTEPSAAVPVKNEENGAAGSTVAAEITQPEVEISGDKKPSPITENKEQIPTPIKSEEENPASPTSSPSKPPLTPESPVEGEKKTPGSENTNPSSSTSEVAAENSKQEDGGNSKNKKNKKKNKKK